MVKTQQKLGEHIERRKLLQSLKDMKAVKEKISSFLFQIEPYV